MTLSENIALRACAFAVLNPSFKPLVRPIARWLLRRYGDPRGI